MKTKGIVILLVGILVFFGCKSENQKKRILHSEMQSDVLDTCVYVYRNDSLSQTIKLVINENELYFDYQVTNFVRNKSITLSGYALLEQSENMELSEDDNGFAYTVDNYIYINGDCNLSISIDNEMQDKINIVACKECFKFDSSLSLNSVGILRKRIDN